MDGKAATQGHRATERSKVNAKLVLRARRAFLCLPLRRRNPYCSSLPHPMLVWANASLNDDVVAQTTYCIWSHLKYAQGYRLHKWDNLAIPKIQMINLLIASGTIRTQQRLIPLA